MSLQAQRFKKAKRQKHPQLKGDNRLLSEARVLVRNLEEMIQEMSPGGNIEFINQNINPHRPVAENINPVEIKSPLRVIQQSGALIRLLLQLPTASQYIDLWSKDPDRVITLSKDVNMSLKAKLARLPG